MLYQLTQWLSDALFRRAKSGAACVSAGAFGVSPHRAEVVSGVSPLIRVPYVTVSLTALGLGVCITSCAEPQLDGLPEDPGQHMPLPTIVSPAASGQSDASVDSTRGDAGMVEPSDDTDSTDPANSTSTNSNATSTGTSGTSTATSGNNSGTSSSSQTSGTGAGSDSSETDETNDGSDVNGDAGGWIIDAGSYHDASSEQESDAGDGGFDADVEGGLEP